MAQLHGRPSRRTFRRATRRWPRSFWPSDRQRLSRALEVVDATGRSLLDWQKDGQDHAPLSGVAVERIFMDVPRAELHARAEQRFDRMLSAGALEEARAMMSVRSVAFRP